MKTNDFVPVPYAKEESLLPKNLNGIYDWSISEDLSRAFLMYLLNNHPESELSLSVKTYYDSMEKIVESRFSQEHGVQVYYDRAVRRETLADFVEHNSEIDSNNDSIDKLKYDKVLSAFLDTNGFAAVYTNKKATAIFIACTAPVRKILHKLCAGIFKIAPWIFTEKPYTDEEIKLMQNMSKEEIDDAVQFFYNLYSEINFREKDIIKFASGFTADSKKNLMNTTRERIRCKSDEIATLKNRISRTLEELRDLNYKLSSMSVSDADTDMDKTIIDFLVSSNISVIDNHNDRLYFCVKTTLDSFDEDVYDSYITASTSTHYPDYLFPDDFDFTVEQYKAIYNAIWYDDWYDLNVYACYSIDQSSMVRAFSGYDNSNRHIDLSGYIPNPHIMGYGCVGDWEVVFTRCSEELDYIGALQAAIQSAKSINFAEEPTCGQLIQDMFSNPDKPYYLSRETGCLLSLREVIQELKESGHWPEN